MNRDDDLRISEMMEQMRNEGKIPYGMDAVAKDLSSKPLPEVLAILLTFKSKNPKAGDLLCDSVLTSILFSYCQTVDEAMAMVHGLKDSLCRMDKALNQGFDIPQE